MSLADLQRRAGSIDRARVTVADVYKRFTEGFATVDLKTAQDLIQIATTRPRGVDHRADFVVPRSGSLSRIGARSLSTRTNRCYALAGNKAANSWLVLGFPSPERMGHRFLAACGARPPLARRQSVCYLLNHIVQYARARFDASFAALSDAKLGLRRLEQEAAWIERYRQLWDTRFDELDKIVEELKQKE